MRKWRDTRWVRWVAAAVVLQVTYTVGEVLTHHGQTLRYVLDDLIYPAGILVATMTTAWAGWRGPRSRRRWWRIVAGASLLWLGADSFWCLNDALGREVGTPSLGDVFLIGSYLLMLISVGLAFGGTSGLRQWRGQLDSLLVIVVVGAAGWRWLIGPQLTGGFSAEVVTLATYPLLDVGFLIVFLSVGLAGHHRLAPQVLLALAGTVLSMGNDVVIALLSAQGSAPDDGIMKSLYFPVILMSIVASVTDRQETIGRDEQVRSVQRDLGFIPITAVVGGVLLWAYLEASAGDISRLVVVLLATLLVGITIRSQLSIRDQRRVARQLDAAVQEQRRLAITDALTGLYNRRFGDEMVQLEAERTLRDGSSMSVVIIDLDHFKSVNDVHGHLAGDVVLGQAAVRVSAALRSSDVLVRWGGEEFFALLPGATGPEAVVVAQRMRTALSSRPLQLPSGERLRVTASFGLASFPSHSSHVDQLIHAADKALYQAKTAGRDQVVLAAYPHHLVPH